jgi:glycosyltransferase involved in cell wall biosynthesis
MKHTRKTKIVNIMPHGPAYHFSPGEKPDIYWEKPDGSFLGLWTREWPDLLGEAVLNQTDKYDWEVWQPDYRADRIYSKKLDTGVCHRLFRANDKTYRQGLKSIKAIFSEEMLPLLREINNPIILVLHAARGLSSPFYSEIIKIFGPKKDFPIFLLGHGMFRAPLSDLFGLHKPLTYLDLIIEHFSTRRLLSLIDVISEQAELALRAVRKVYRGRIEKLTMGCDFYVWLPVPSINVKQLVRQGLNIPPDKMVFLASGNFTPGKQLDKLIEVFCQIQNRNDFYLLIAGHGDESYSNRLAYLIAPLKKQKKAILHPYVTGEELRNLYWSSDVYASASKAEGSSVAVMKAMACGLPILSTPVGETSELMKKHNTGVFLPVKRYSKWAKAIEKILDNGPCAPIDISVAREAYDWPNIAKRFIKIFDELLPPSDEEAIKLS